MDIGSVHRPLESEGRRFFRDSEDFAPYPMPETPSRKAGDILGRGNNVLWRLFFDPVAKAHGPLDLSGLVHPSVDQRHCRKAHQ